MFRDFLCSFLGLIILVSCNNYAEEIKCDISLNGKIVKISPADSYKFPRILINDILISGKDEHYCSSLTNKECSKAEFLFKFGNGHNEFQFISFGRGVDNSLLLLDHPMVGNKIKSLTIVKTDSIESLKDTKNWEKYNLLGLPAFRFTTRWFASLSDSTILVTGAPYDAIGHLFSIIDFKNQKLQPLEYWPDDGVNCDSLPKHSVYADNSRLYGNGKGHFLYKCNNERFAFVFSIVGNKINVIKELYSVFPDYTSDKTKQNYIYKHLSPKTIECTASDSNIYVLLRDSDRKGNMLDELKNPYVYGNIVQVFDWDGNIVKTILLDKYGQDVFVSEDNKTLYLFTKDYFEEESKPEIWAYELNDLNL